MTLAQGMLLVPTGQSLLFIDPVTGRILRRFDPGKGVSSTPAIYGSDALVMSNLGYVYGMHLTAPSRL